LLPETHRIFSGCRLLQEASAMPQRFLFFEVGHLAERLSRVEGDEAELVLLFGRADPALEALVEAGLATKLSNADGSARYDCRAEDHYHLRDVRTGEIRDLHVPFDGHLLAKLDPELVASAFEAVTGKLHGQKALRVERARPRSAR
jgi:hypothetical protein